MNRLQKALLTNAIFSGISGITLILASQKMAQLFGVTTNTPFWVVGAALIFFTITIVYEMVKQRYWAVLWIIIQDFIWVIGSAILIILNPFSISQNGILIIAGVAIVVLFMGINQAVALKQNKLVDIMT